MTSSIDLPLTDKNSCDSDDNDDSSSQLPEIHQEVGGAKETPYITTKHQPLLPSSRVSIVTTNGTDWSPASSGPPSLYGGNDWSSMTSSASSSAAAAEDADFSDVDLIFDVDLDSADKFDLYKRCTLQALVDFLPEHVERARITPTLVQDAYVKKMVKIASVKYGEWIF